VQIVDHLGNDGSKGTANRRNVRFRQLRQRYACADQQPAGKPHGRL